MDMVAVVEGKAEEWSVVRMVEEVEKLSMRARS